MFCHNVKTKSSKFVEFNNPIKGEITHADMTCSPFIVVKYLYLPNIWFNINCHIGLC